MTRSQSNTKTAARLFQVGAWVFLLMGWGHALGTLVDVFRPFLFTPVDSHVKEMMIEAIILITDRMSLWNAWLGFNLSHGYGVGFFGLISLLLARSNFDDVIKLKPLFPLVIFMALSYLIMAIVFWFYLPAYGCTVGLGCFATSFFLVRHQWSSKKGG